MQTIIDFLVKDQTGKMVLVSHRSNSDHIQNGASDTLVHAGIALYKSINQSDSSKWINDTIDVVDYYNTSLFTTTILAKSKRLWDMERPIGSRLIAENKSRNWDFYFDIFLNGK